MNEDLLEELSAVFLEFDRSLAEKEQNPFNATGPRGGSDIGGANLPGYKSTPRGETDDWSCRCANYQCQCSGPNGQTKRFSVNPAYKAGYNAAYREKYGAWRRGKKKKASGKKKAA